MVAACIQSLTFAHDCMHVTIMHVRAHTRITSPQNHKLLVRGHLERAERALPYAIPLHRFGGYIPSVLITTRSHPGIVYLSEVPVYIRTCKHEVVWFYGLLCIELINAPYLLMARIHTLHVTCVTT